VQGQVIIGVGSNVREGGPALPLTYLEVIMEGNELLTIAEAARLLKLSRKTIERKIRAGTIPAYRLPGGRRVFIRRSDLLSALERVEPMEKNEGEAG